MTAVRLDQTRVHKPWGRRDLPAQFGAVADHEPPVGELIFSHPDYGDAELLVKYLFTSEKLSIQVHPDDDAAHRLGQRRGKNEAWYILSAEPGATIAMGPREKLTPEELKRAALDGSLEGLVNWVPAEADTALYAPAGTIHAIGAGLALVEVQQNSDTTYRLFDYGRPRELHLDDAMAVSNLEPLVVESRRSPQAEGRTVLIKSDSFGIEHWRTATAGRLSIRQEQGCCWLIPLDRCGRIADQPVEPGSVWIVEGDALLQLESGATLLIAHPAEAAPELAFDAQHAT